MKTKLTSSMNALQRWHRGIELKFNKTINAQEAAELLEISLSYYTKLSSDARGITKNIKNKMEKILK